MGKLTVYPLMEGVWQLHEEGVGAPVDAYLVEGTQRSVVIDSLQDTEELYETVGTLTQRPIDLVLTHGHLDHVGKSTDHFKRQGCTVYLKEEDEAILGKMGSQAFPQGYFQTLQQGQMFPLGGRALEVLLLPGHTAGSVVLLDRENHLLFSGDSIGSGPFWLQLPHSLSVATFLNSVSRLLEEVAPMEDLLVLPGHRVQSPTPLGLPYVKDVQETARRILDGSLVGKEECLAFEGMQMGYKVATLGSMQGFCYDPGKVGD